MNEYLNLLCVRYFISLFFAYHNVLFFFYVCWVDKMSIQNNIVPFQEILSKQEIV